MCLFDITGDDGRQQGHLRYSPSYDLGLRSFDHLRSFLNKFSPSPSRIQLKPFPRVDLPWGSFCEVKSSESPEGMMGKGFDLIVVDEASRIPRNVFEQFIYPRISSKKGKILIISTPLKKDWFYEEWLKSKTDPNGASFQFSSDANPTFPKGQIEEMEKKLPKAIVDREFRAVFSDEITSIFKNVRECVSNELHKSLIGWTFPFDWFGSGQRGRFYRYLRYGQKHE